MLDQSRPDSTRPPELLTIHGALQALTVAACELTGAQGVAICAPAGPMPDSDLYVITATGETPAVGALCSPAHLAGPHQRYPLRGGDPASSAVIGTLILFMPHAEPPAAAWTALVAAVGLTLYNAQVVEQSRRTIDGFLSIVSHELRTPLSAILGYSDILLRGLHGPLNERQARAQAGVRANATRLLHIINDLIDVTKLEAREIQLLPAPQDLSQAVQTAIQAVQSFAAGGNVTLHNGTSATLPPVLADDERLHQILLNLLTNAIKFTPPDGQVSVRARPSALPAAAPPDSLEPPPPSGPPRSVELTVQDTGIGLTGDQAARVWERFYQADSTSRRRYGGTGLGLYIVRILVELHGGVAWVTSAGRNQGTTFHLRLPLAAVPVPRPSLPDLAPAPASRRQEPE